MVGPQTTREALMAELLGDVGGLLDRMEALKVELPEVADGMAGKVEAAGKSSVAAIRTASQDAASKIGDTLEGVQSAAREAKAAAAMVTGAANRFAFLALLTGIAGGAIGGALAAIALT